MHLHVAARKVPRQDKLENCAELAAAGKCATDVQNMKLNCNKSCLDWSEKELKFKKIPLQESFFDLSATKAGTKKSIDFERFEGYYTLILPLAKTCGGQVAPKTMFDSITKTKEMFTYALEVIVFPYEHPSVNYNEKDCSDFEEFTTQTDTKLYIMEDSKLNGKDSHPVFSYFLNEMKIKEFDLETLFYFVVTPDGDRAMYHYDQSLKDLQVSLRQYVKSLDYNQKKKEL